MNKVIKMLMAFCLLSQLRLVHAETQKSFTYQNQREEAFDLENWLKEIQYKDEQVKDTCHKQVPHDVNVCKDITKYKKECENIPAHESCKNVNHPICHSKTHYESECTTLSHRECHNESSRQCHNETSYENVCSTTPDRQECRTVNEPSCHYETRYENQCSTVPGQQECSVVIRYHEECQQTAGGRQCHTVPPDIRCRVINGENKCEKIPGHEECSNGPGQRVCHQAPYEERECHQGSSHQECHQVARQEQVCEDVSDRPICHDVPKTEQVCSDNWSKECHNVPTEEVCKNVPYKEQVCKIESQMKDEPYECMKTIKVPHEVLVTTHKASVQVEFDARSNSINPDFQVSLATDGSLSILAKDSQDTHAMAFAKKDIHQENIENINSIMAVYKIILFDQAENFKFLETGIKNIQLKSRSLVFFLDGKVETKRLSMNLNISKKGDVKFEQKIAGNKVLGEFDGEKTKITIDLQKLGAPKLGGIFNRVHDVNLKVALDFSDLGENLISNGKELSVNTIESVKVD